MMEVSFGTHPDNKGSWDIERDNAIPFITVPMEVLPINVNGTINTFKETSIIDLYPYIDYIKFDLNQMMGEQKYIDIKESMEKYGWKMAEPALFAIRLGFNRNEVDIRDGNHRLLIAKELKIKTIPVIWELLLDFNQKDKRRYTWTG